MPITKGAHKAHRASLKKRVYNLRRSRTMQELIKDIRTKIANGNTKEASALIPQAQAAIDKATKRGVIKKNTADRKKSRLVAAIKRAGA